MATRGETLMRSATAFREFPTTFPHSSISRPKSKMNEQRMLFFQIPDMKRKRMKVSDVGGGDGVEDL